MKSTSSRYGYALSIYQDTSRDAWAAVDPHLADVDAKILAVVIRLHGATTPEVKRDTGMKHQTVSAQIRHMVEGGLLEHSGVKRAIVEDGKLGRRCIVWQIVRRAEETTPAFSS